MNNFPPELQSRLVQLEWCIKNQSPEQALFALDELENLLLTHYHHFYQAHQALQQLHSSTKTKQVDGHSFPWRRTSSRTIPTTGIDLTEN